VFLIVIHCISILSKAPHGIAVFPVKMHVIIFFIVINIRNK